MHAIPSVIDFQGKLADSLNSPQTGVFNMYFSIYNQSTGGNMLWQENKSVSVSSGLFSTFLGSVNSLNMSFGENYFVEINISGEVFAPRYRVATVPYAFRANISEYAIAANTTTPSFIIRRIPGQVSNLTEWRNFSGNVISYVNAEGQFVGSFVGDGSQLTGVGLVNATQNLSAANITAGTFGANVGGGSYTFPENLIVNRNFTAGNLFFVNELLRLIGIGTSTPAYMLDVNGSVNAHSFLINGTSILNGTVSGSGTTGYIPQWQTNGILNDSIIYQNGTNIGIGTTSPTALLQINGTNAANGISLNVSGVLYVNTSSSGVVNNGSVVIGGTRPGPIISNFAYPLYINDQRGIGIKYSVSHAWQMSVDDASGALKFNNTANTGSCGMTLGTTLASFGCSPNSGGDFALSINSGNILISPQVGGGIGKVQV
ncbi:MAG TPA: hypothetical protein VJI12_00985, partial [archaeon]|nr:hypothetical protein [archaeon]